MSVPLVPQRISGLPLATHFAALCAAVAIPLLLLSGYLLYQTGYSERAQIEARASEEAWDIALLLESELSGMIGMLHALASSPTLQGGDIAAFDRRARELMVVEGVDIVLRDRFGQQLVNTREPSGAPLPRSTGEVLAFDQLTVETRSPQVSGLMAGAVATTPLYLVEVPVIRNGEVVYLLNLSLPIERLGTVLGNQGLPAGWWAALMDRSGTVMARTLAPEAMIGNKAAQGALDVAASGVLESSTYLTSPEGIRNFTAFRRTKASGWMVAVAVPEKILLAPLFYSLKLIALLVGVAMASSVWLAFLYSARISRNVIGLTKTITALGTGEPIHPFNSPVRELNAANVELAIRASERDHLLETLGRSPAIVRALDGRISFWGSGAERLYGWSRAEAVGRVCSELLASEFTRPLSEIQAELLSRGAWEGEFTCRSRDGQQVIVASHWALQRDPLHGTPLAVVETNTDITAKRAEQRMAVARAEAETASSAKSTFLAAASHDLRQPFQAMRLFHQILEAKAGPELALVVDHLGKAMSSGEELLAGILDLSVLETGSIEPNPSNFPIGEVLIEIADDCAAVAKAANLTLHCVAVNAIVHTDRILLKRMVRNLVVNAIRYTNEGGILIGCRRRNGKLVVQVVDTGIGIPQDRLAWIFEEFYQVSNPSRDRARGLGLGLAIVSRLSRLLGHPVAVTSVPGRGSTFSVELAVIQ